MTERTRPYHHGDLRSELLEMARQQVKEHGIEDFSIRRCAQEIGVHPTAAYRHYKTKGSLIGELASEGFGDLVDAMELGLSKKGDPSERLIACGVSYITFAIRSPNMFRAIFFAAGKPDLKALVSPKRDRDAYQILHDCLTDLQLAGKIGQEDVKTLTPILWSTVHGLADLYLLGLLNTNEIEIQNTCQELVRKLIR